MPEDSVRLPAPTTPTRSTLQIIREAKLSYLGGNGGLTGGVVTQSQRRGHTSLRPNKELPGRLEKRVMEFLSTQNNGGMRVHKLNRSYPVSGLTKCGDREVSEFQRQQQF